MPDVGEAGPSKRIQAKAVNPSKTATPGLAKKGPKVVAPSDKPVKDEKWKKAMVTLPDGTDAIDLSIFSSDEAEGAETDSETVC